MNTTTSSIVIHSKAHSLEEKKKQAEKNAKKAEEHAKRANAQADHSETLARKADFKVKNLLYTYEVKIRLAEESAVKANTENDAWIQYSEAITKANVKKAVFEATKDIAKLNHRIGDKKKGVSNHTDEGRLASVNGNNNISSQEKAGLEIAQAKRRSMELEKAKNEWNNAVLVAKKAKKIAEDAAEANVVRNRLINEAAQVKAEVEKHKIEAEMRMAEAQSRRAEAKSKLAEAKAWKANNENKAEDWRNKAIAHKQAALEVRKAFDLKKTEGKTRAASKSLAKSDKKISSFEETLPNRVARFGEKKHLSAPGLINSVKQVFQRIADQAQNRQNSRSGPTLCDCLMSGFALFSLKYPSLLQFDQDGRQAYEQNKPCEENLTKYSNGEKERLECVRHNLHTLYQINRPPSDTYMRECLDDVDPILIRPAFKQLFAQLQRGKELEQFSFYNGHYLLGGDASQYFSSNEIHCGNCCVKHHRDGHVSYYHQLMSAVIIHPNQKVVIPLCPEPIVNMINAAKNDCEQRAAERLFRNIRREHPHLPLIVAYDNLQSNGSFVQLLDELDMRYILVVSPEGNKSLFEFLKGVKLTDYTYFDEKFIYKIRYVNNIPLNDVHVGIDVNFLEASVYDVNGELQYHNSWITDIMITNDNAYRLYQGGRARWKVENETFNTLKNQGYNFEHNFGHGNKHLSTIFALLMMLAFLTDQIQQLCCGMFQSAWENMKTKVRLWEKLRAYFFSYKIASWEQVWRALTFGIIGGELTPRFDSS